MEEEGSIASFFLNIVFPIACISSIVYLSNSDRVRLNNVEYRINDKLFHTRVESEITTDYSTERYQTDYETVTRWIIDNNDDGIADEYKERKLRFRSRSEYGQGFDLGRDRIETPMKTIFVGKEIPDSIQQRYSRIIEKRNILNVQMPNIQAKIDSIENICNANTTSQLQYENALKKTDHNIFMKTFNELYANVQKDN
ncbi:MAG TPA: hypothetical protein VEC16_03805 [Alphaproteobacteria bacterium]|nr:hypothetical protein [Alphaproteobacteria bacterium]